MTLLWPTPAASSWTRLIWQGRYDAADICDAAGINVSTLAVPLPLTSCFQWFCFQGRAHATVPELRRQGWHGPCGGRWHRNMRAVAGRAAAGTGTHTACFPLCTRALSRQAPTDGAPLPACPPHAHPLGWLGVAVTPRGVGGACLRVGQNPPGWPHPEARSGAEPEPGWGLMPWPAWHQQTQKCWMFCICSGCGVPEALHPDPHISVHGPWLAVSCAGIQPACAAISTDPTWDSWR